MALRQRSASRSPRPILLPPDSPPPEGRGRRALNRGEFAAINRLFLDDMSPFRLWSPV